MSDIKELVIGWVLVVMFVCFSAIGVKSCVVKEHELKIELLKAQAKYDCRCDHKKGEFGER